MSSRGLFPPLGFIVPATETDTYIYLNGEIAIARILTRNVGCAPLAAASCSRFSSSNARRCCLLTDSMSFMPRCCCSAILLSAASACLLRIVSCEQGRCHVKNIPGWFHSATERRRNNRFLKEIIFERPRLVPGNDGSEDEEVYQACQGGSTIFFQRFDEGSLIFTCAFITYTKKRTRSGVRSSYDDASLLQKPQQLPMLNRYPCEAYATVTGNVAVKLDQRWTRGVRMTDPSNGCRRCRQQSPTAICTCSTVTRHSRLPWHSRMSEDVHLQLDRNHSRRPAARREFS